MRSDLASEMVYHAILEPAHAKATASTFFHLRQQHK